MSGRLERAGLEILRRPRTVLAGTALLAALAVALLLRFRIDPDLEHLMPPGDPTLRLTRHLQGASPPTRVLFVVLRSDDAADLERVVPSVAEALQGSSFLSEVGL